MNMIRAVLPCQRQAEGCSLVGLFPGHDTDKWMRYFQLNFEKMPSLSSAKHKELTEVPTAPDVSVGFNLYFSTEFHPLMAPDGCIIQAILFFNYTAHSYCVGNQGYRATMGRLPFPHYSVGDSCQYCSVQSPFSPPFTRYDIEQKLMQRKFSLEGFLFV